MVAHVREKDPSTHPVNFLSESDHRFADLHSTRDRIAHETLTNRDWSWSSVSWGNHWWGGGSHVEKRYPGNKFAFKPHEHSFLRHSFLCLWSGEEHWSLKSLQFQFDKNGGGDRVVYVENGSKNWSGSYKDKAGNKVIKQYAQPQPNDKCYAYLVRLYCSKLPKFAFQKDVSTGVQKRILPLAQSSLGLKGRLWEREHLVKWWRVRVVPQELKTTTCLRAIREWHACMKEMY